MTSEVMVAARGRGYVSGMHERSKAAGCGPLLRHWRATRKMSQLDLALESGVSARHISCVESGKAAPSRELLMTLADALSIPLRERNALLNAAGYAHLYGLRSLDAPELQPVLRALRTVVERTGPYPAAAFDGQWNLLFANAAAERLFAPLLDGSERNFARIFFGERTRAFVANWEEAARHFADRLHREALADPRSRALFDELVASGRISREHARLRVDQPALPVIPVELHAGEARLRLFTTITTLGTPVDVGLSELRIESYLPADDESEALLRMLSS
jgi:transcriptional regulator with XRE-family HTH domain